MTCRRRSWWGTAQAVCPEPPRLRPATGEGTSKLKSLEEQNLTQVKQELQLRDLEEWERKLQWRKHELQQRELQQQQAEATAAALASVPALLCCGEKNPVKPLSGSRNIKLSVEDTYQDLPS